MQLVFKAELVSEEVEKRILDMELRVEANEFKARQKQREEVERLRQQSEEDDDDDDDDDGGGDDDDGDGRKSGASKQAGAKQVSPRDMPPPAPRAEVCVDGRSKGAEEKRSTWSRKEQLESVSGLTTKAPQRSQHRSRK